MTGPPLVHVVVVDHDGGALTLECARSLLASDWPPERLRVVLVDNASRRPVADAVAREMPAVRVVRSEVNRGFAGGANLGLCERGDADLVAIVNNDATVEPGWLGPLADTLRDDPTVGAACPKIRLATPAIEVTLTTPTRRRGRGDRRALGVRVSGARVDGRDVWDRAQLVDGFWGHEPMPAGEAGGQWTTARAVLRVPSATRPAAIALRLAAEHPTPVRARSGHVVTDLTVTTEPTWHTVGSDAEPVEVLNNVGTVVHPDGYASDRGWLEVDRGQYDEPADVDAWCGAAVLVSRAYLDDVGLFDERLFLYYEDVDLSLRGARRGWRYRTAPASLVRHVHAATSLKGSETKGYYDERNRLLVAARSSSLPATARAFARHLLVTGSYARRDLVAPLLRGERPHGQIVSRRLRAWARAAIDGFSWSRASAGPAQPAD